MEREAARVIIVDDHDLVRVGLREMLADEPSVEVVGEATCGRGAVALSARLRPDVVLMDVRMPGMDGLAATREIKRAQPFVSVLMVTMHGEPDYLLEALKAGAAGYVLKGASRERLVSAVLNVVSGESPMDPTLSARLLKRLVDDPGRLAPPGNHDGRVRAGQQAAPSAESLSPRELEVLRLLARGHTNRKIGEILTLSPGTVKRHVEHILAKLEVSDRTQVAVRAYELNLIGPPGGRDP